MPWPSPITIEGGEGEAPAALDDLGDPVDLDLAGLGTAPATACPVAVVHLRSLALAIQNSSPASRAASATAATRP